MKNYFKECASLPVPKKTIKTIDKEDFEASEEEIEVTDDEEEEVEVDA